MLAIGYKSITQFKISMKMLTHVPRTYFDEAIYGTLSRNKDVQITCFMLEGKRNIYIYFFFHSGRRRDKTERGDRDEDKHLGIWSLNVREIHTAPLQARNLTNRQFIVENLPISL